MAWLMMSAVLLCSALPPAAAQSDPTAKAGSVDGWIRALEDPNPLTRMKAAGALENMGPAAKRAIPALRKMLSSSSSRVFAAQALLKVDPTATPSLVPILVEALRDSDPTRGFHRVLAAQLLGNIGPPAASGVPALVEALQPKDDTAANEGLRQEAANALGRIGPLGASEAVPALARALKDVSPVVREVAAQSLRHVGPDAGRAVTELAEALADDSNLVRLHAAEALGELGPSARAATSALRRALEDENSYVRTAAGAALARIEAK